MIKMILAMDRHKLIGIENRLPWHKPADLRFFKEQTAGKKVLMGLNTYASMKKYYKDKSFPFDKVYVADFGPQRTFTDAIQVFDAVDFIKEKKEKNEEIYIIGGKTIYEILFEYTDELIVTLVLGEYYGDTYVNIDITEEHFILENEIINEKEGLIFSFYKRR